MPQTLTLNDVLLLVLTIAAVVAVTVFVIFLHQLKKTAKEGENTLKEMQVLARNLNKISQKLDTKIEDVGEVVDATKQTVLNLAEAAFFLTTKIVRPASKFWPFLFPLIKLGWRQAKKKKKKENKDGE